jgi:L-alanine-DL-glutamate epimerase-like enolase superfamily enzyme
MARLRLQRIEVYLLEPGPSPFQDSTMSFDLPGDTQGTSGHFTLQWLRLTASDGKVGQAPCRGPLPSPLVNALLRCEGAGKTVDEWCDTLWWQCRNGGHRSPSTSTVIHAVDMAMRDILAQRAGLPWHRYMGATRDTVPCYASGGSCHLSSEELVAEMKSYVAEGFTTVKMKVANPRRSVDDDVERVRLVREAIGPSIGLAIDANQIYSSAEAAAFAAKVAQYDIAWFEEPVHSADRRATKEIIETCPFPVAMGESENHPMGLWDLSSIGCQHPQPCPAALGSFTQWLKGVEHARAGSQVCAIFCLLLLLHCPMPLAIDSLTLIPSSNTCRCGLAAA